MMRIKQLLIFSLFLGAALLVYCLTLMHANESKTAIMDWATGITISAGILLLFIAYNDIKTFPDFRSLQTLSKNRMFFLSNFFWLLLLPGSVLHFSFRDVRSGYSPTEIGWAPVMIAFFIIILLIPLNLFLCFTAIDAKHPTVLFPKINKYNSDIITYEIFFGFWLVLNLCCFIWFVKIGDHVAIPVNLFFTYLLLNIRAGKISKHIENAGHEYST